MSSRKSLDAPQKAHLLIALAFLNNDHISDLRAYSYVQMHVISVIIPLILIYFLMQICPLKKCFLMFYTIVVIQSGTNLQDKINKMFIT
jgi:hypothetical protein